MAGRRANVPGPAQGEVAPVHQRFSQYEARVRDLADGHVEATGRKLIEAARAFENAVVDYLEAWEDEFDDGQSFRRPINFPEVGRIFTFEARRLAERVEFLR